MLLRLLLSFADYILGLAVFAAVAAAATATATLVLRRRLRHLRGAPAVLGFVTIGLCALLAMHLLPGMLGVLSRGTVIGTGALVFVAVFWLVPAREPPRGPPVRDAPSSRLSIALASATVLAVGGVLLAAAWQGSATPATGDDSLTFHLPNVAAWIESGSFWRVDQFTPLQANGNYPHTGDVVFLSVVLPWRNDAFTNLVNVPFVALAALSVYAIGRELDGPRTTSAAVAATFAALPLIGLTVTDGAFTDPVMLATFGTGVLFLVRHHRTGQTAELVLAGAALGLAFGTKWHAVPAVAVVLATWAGGALLAGRRPATVARQAAQVAGPTLLVGGFWLARNWVESGNPVMPLKVGFAGVTVFDAARDVRDCVGFSIAHYVDAPGVLRDYVLPGYRHFLSLPGLVLALAPALAVVAARSGGEREGPRRPAPVRVVSVCAALLAVVYLFTPYTALGLEGAPVGAGGNTRYLLPALLLAAPLAAWAGGRDRRMRVIVELLAAVAVVEGLRRGYGVSVSAAVLGAGVLALAAATAHRARSSARRSGRGAILACACGAAAVAGCAALAHQRQLEFNDARYRGAEPSIDWILDHAPAGRRVGLAGVWDSRGLVPVLPAFGPRLENEVSYVGEYRRGLLHEYEDRAAFLAAVERGGFDLLIVGNDDYPKRCRLPGSGRQENAWARSAGFPKLAGSGRLTLYRVPDGAPVGAHSGVGAGLS